MWTQITFPKLKSKVIFLINLGGPLWKLLGDQKSMSLPSLNKVITYLLIGSILLEVKVLKTCRGFPISILVKSYRKICK